MKQEIEGRVLSVRAVCAEASACPHQLVEREEARYRDEVAEAARIIHNGRTNRHIVLLSGPSSSGKTTTAARLKAELEQRGTAAHVVSLDNFYLGEGKAPLLPDGKPDYESLDALDTDRLMTCLRELVQDGRTALPVFNFIRHRPEKESQPLVLEADAAVILEGIHAFNPRIAAWMPPENTTKLFINALSRFELDGERWLARRDVRLSRRILRDDQFRDSPFSHTMEMWPQVVRGEDVYLFPFAGTADMVIDTTFAYEPCLLKTLLLPLLSAVPPDAPNADTAAYLIRRLSVFPDMTRRYLPASSMLREFTG